MEFKTTPFDIAEDVIKVTLPETDYNSVTQTRFDSSDASMSITWNATQTFNSSGQPTDSDND